MSDEAQAAPKPTTRCKFHCTRTENLEFGGTKVYLSAKYPDPAVDGYAHGENHAFFNATPSGEFWAQITNAYGAELFQPGKDYYFDISEANVAPPAAA